MELQAAQIELSGVLDCAGGCCRWSRVSRLLRLGQVHWRRQVATSQKVLGQKVESVRTFSNIPRAISHPGLYFRRSSPPSRWAAVACGQRRASHERVFCSGHINFDGVRTSCGREQEIDSNPDDRARSGRVYYKVHLAHCRNSKALTAESVLTRSLLCIQ